MSELKEHLFVPYSELREGDELTDAFTIAKSYYLKSEVDKTIAELKAQVNGFHNRANLWLYNAQNEHNEAVAVRMENAKLKEKADKLLSCLKCLVMRDLIKDCPEKESAIEIVKEYK